jgi:hypothetical protein
MADIDQLKLHEKTRINEEIRMNQKYNELDCASLTRFRASGADKYTLTQTEKLTVKVNDRTQFITEMEERLVKLEMGELDADLLKTVKDNTKVAKEKHDEYVVTKKLKAAQKAEDAALSKEFYDKERKNDKLSKSYFYNSSLRHFNKAEDTLPEWMKSELANMANNDGIIWKSVYFFGLKHRNGNPFTQVTEYKKGLKIIHRWDTTTMSIYEKRGRDREILVSREPRKKIA